MTNVQPKFYEFFRSHAGMRNCIWGVRRWLHAVERRLFVRRPVMVGGPIFRDVIAACTPFAAGKMGSIEAVALFQYLARIKARRAHLEPPPYSARILRSLHVNAGVFPQDPAVFDRFGEVYLNAVRGCDALVAWDVACEARIFADYCPDATLIHLRDLEPYFSLEPWSQVLRNKRVLVVSPFAASVERQYARREAVWGGRDILPSFSLSTIRAPLSAALVPPQYVDWFDALDSLKKRMDEVDYDVALIGAGAYSLPLAIQAKSRGKVGIHLGGALQILFGILGKRWSENEDFAPFINAAWVMPNQDETPKGCNIVEGGCYW